MTRKKIWLDGWFTQNLGDDLFLYSIINRYKNVDFYYYSNEKYNKFKKNYSNITKYSKYSLKLECIKKNLFNCLCKVFKNKKKYYVYDFCKFDYSVLISGSYFMESDKKISSDFVKNSFNTKIPYYIIGVNFGPYKTKKYLNVCKDIFSKANDVCFRESNSYKLFSDLPNVRFAPDIVFGMDVNKFNINTNNNNIAIISVCDITKNGKNKYFTQEEYERKIVDIIEILSNKNYKCKLMSFSKIEGDERVIKSIKKKLNYKIETYYYRNDVEESLQILANSSLIIGTRYHANILGFILNKTVIPISYSNKMTNVLNDMNFKGLFFDLNKKNGFDVQLLKNADLNYKIDVNRFVVDSNNHFKELDKILK